MFQSGVPPSFPVCIVCCKSGNVPKRCAPSFPVCIVCCKSGAAIMYSNQDPCTQQQKFVTLLRTQKNWDFLFPTSKFNYFFYFFGGKNSSKFFYAIKLKNKTLRFKTVSHMPEKKRKKKRRAQYCLKTHNIDPHSITTHV